MCKVKAPLGGGEGVEMKKGTDKEGYERMSDSLGDEIRWVTNG